MAEIFSDNGCAALDYVVGYKRFSLAVGDAFIDRYLRYREGLLRTGQVCTIIGLVREENCGVHW